VLPRHVRLLVEVAPQDPVVLTSCVLAEAHVPKALWHPSPQYAEVEPQNPLGEQQLPNVEVRHVALLSELELQFPSMLVGFEVRVMRKILTSVNCCSKVMGGVLRGVEGGVVYRFKASYGSKVVDAHAIGNIQKRYSRGHFIAIVTTSYLR
jgi:hypothetical protein